ncbi:ARM repeat-containing protein, partial [Rozella allomycis CSF55]
MSGLLMHVIRFVMPNSNKNKILKKLMLMFYEITPKVDGEGRMQQEWILACNALQNDLKHANEYVRGATLRFVSKLKQVEILEPLMPNIRQCLEHKNAYVRRNAVYALYRVYCVERRLVPDASELIVSFVRGESDKMSKRNGFNMLVEIDKREAIKYLLESREEIKGYDSLMQMAILELIKKDDEAEQGEKMVYMKILIDLISSSGSSAVRFDAANILLRLTSNGSAVKEVGRLYVELAIKEGDNNVKLIVLNKFKELKDRFKSQVEDLSVEMIKIISCSDFAIKSLTIEIILDLLNGKNEKYLVDYFKKELFKREQEDEK